MSNPVAPVVTVTDVGYCWPDGSTALSGISGSFGSGRTGVVGVNGAGKSTLLRLIAGELTPATGHIATSGDVAYLPQTLTLDVDAPVAELLGVAEPIAALRAIEHGDTADHHFDVLGDDWDIETRATQTLHDVGLGSISLDRRVGELSGGEVMLLALTGLWLRRATITLADEPTNNLDRHARNTLTRLVGADAPGPRTGCGPRRRTDRQGREASAHRGGDHVGAAQPRRPAGPAE